MVLLQPQIQEAIKNKEIIFDGDLLNIGPNSIDVSLAPTIKTYVESEIQEFIYKKEKHYTLIQKEQSFEWHLDAKKDNPTWIHSIPEEGLILRPDQFYIAGTIEMAGSSSFIPMYEGRSSMARLGILSHLSAGFGDVGFENRWTLEIKVAHPVKVYPGMRIGQVAFHSVDPDVLFDMKNKNELYQSKYSINNQSQSSKSHLDFATNGNSLSRISASSNKEGNSNEK